MEQIHRHNLDTLKIFVTEFYLRFGSGIFGKLDWSVYWYNCSLMTIVTKELDLCLKNIYFGLRNCKTILFDDINEGMQVFKMLVNGLREN